MKKLFVSIVLGLYAIGTAGMINAAVISTEFYEISELQGNFNWATTDWNHGYTSSDDLNNTTHLKDIDSILSDGYTHRLPHQRPYNGIATDDAINTIIYDFSTAQNVDMLSMLTTRLGNANYSSIEIKIEQYLSGSLIGTYAYYNGWYDGDTYVPGNEGEYISSLLDTNWGYTNQATPPWTDMQISAGLTDQIVVNITGGTHYNPDVTNHDGMIIHEIQFSDPTAPSPVPVPGAIWLLGSGLLGLVWVNKRI